MQESEEKWERVLWKKQPYPDNYVGDSFLRVSKKRLEVHLSEAIYQSTAVSQEICSCMGLVAVFFGLANDQFRATEALISTAVLCSMGFILTNNSRLSAAIVRENAKLVIFYIVLISCASPVVKTLTGSVATDSIHACTTALLIMRLLCYDYGAVCAMVNPTVSHNLGVFASVCLASRLKSNQDVFALITVAVALFTLFPSFRRFCKMELGYHCDILMTIIVVGISFASVWIYAPVQLTPLLVVTLLFCNLVCPGLYVYLQNHKQNIYGPWDEAQIEDTTINK